MLEPASRHRCRRPARVYDGDTFLRHAVGVAEVHELVHQPRPLHRHQPE